jgi:hypothetical protein
MSIIGEVEAVLEAALYRVIKVKILLICGGFLEVKT